MKNLISKRTVAIAAAFAALLVAAPAQAQVAEFDVPFPFLLQDKVLPAGQYVVRADAGSQTVALRLPSGTSMGLAMSVPVRRPASAPAVGSAVFQKYGKTYVLKTVWSRGVREGFQLPVSSAERELARAYTPAEVATVGAR